jgi:uncharacterized damage-inducible protein DinB
VSRSLLFDPFAHHVWATEQLIDACSGLTTEQLETTAPGTYGSIIGTLRHLVSSDGWYLTFFRKEGVVEVEEEADTSLADLRSVFLTNGAAWMDVVAGDLDADEDIVERDGDLEVLSPVGLRLAQVVHHGTDHRSQVCTALTSLGIEPPEIDLWAWARATGRERVANASTT